MIEECVPGITKCVRCGKCIVLCPIYEELGWESTSARGRLLTALALSEGVEITPSMIEGINTCVTCGICAINCPSDAHADEVSEACRAEMRLKGYQSDAHKALAERVKTSGNTLNESGPRLNWIDYKPKDKAEYVFFVGCLDSYRFQEATKDAFDVLSKFDVALLSDEKCCGSPLLRTGQDATDLIEHNIAEIKKLGAKKVITSCAGCYTTLKVDYPKYSDVDFEVVHISEFLNDKLDELSPKKLEMTVTYHDPCHIGRHHKIYDPPREIINAICDLKEMERNKASSRCCGGGGGVRLGYDDLSLSLAKKRMGDVPDDVDYIVTPCPLCERNLEDAGGKVIQLSTLVKMALDD